MILRSIFSFILSMVFMPQVQGGAEQIFLSKNIDKHQRKTLSRDLDQLKSMRFGAAADPLTLKVMGLEDVNTSSLLDWLSDRVSVVIEDVDVDKLNLKAKRFFNYPRNAEPTIEKPLVAPSTGGVSKGVTVMSNIGTGLYFAGKSSQQLFTLKVKSGFLSSKSFDIKSPRTGVIQIGEGLFLKKYLMNKENELAPANSLGRMAVFFHEARHSDGNGESLGFFHAVCPTDHDFAGVHACDRNLNGPYTVGAQIIKEFINNCDQCSVSEKEQMRLRYIDSLNRVLKTTPVIAETTDDDVQMLSLELDTQKMIYQIETMAGKPTLVTYKKIIEIEKNLLAAAQRANAVELVPSKYWNASSESI